MTLQEQILLEDKFNDFTINLEKYTDKAKDLVSIFKQNKNKIKEIEKRDIQYWEKQTPEDFTEFVNNLSQVKSNTQQKVEQKTSGADLIYEDDEWLVYHIKTEEASKLLGKGTKWCISAKNNNYFNSYVDDVTFYFFISKILTQHDPNYKIAAAVYPEGTVEYFDASDNEIDKPEFLPNIKLKSFIPDYIIHGTTFIRLTNKSLTEFTIPKGITSIGNYAFSGCIGLTNITIPNSVISIGNSAFSYCDNLTNITIPDSVTSIGNSAFSGCRELTNITIPNSVTSIGQAAFSECYSLTSITIPNSVTSIGIQAFQDCRELTNITIPNSVTSIGNYAFNSCKSLTSITIPDSVTSISDFAFSGCIGLTNITIPNSVTSIGQAAFSGCIGLTSITIPDSVTSISDFAFSFCDNLTNITIPNSVTSIGIQAFQDCRELTNITIPNSVTSIGNGAFYDCNNLTIYTNSKYVEEYAKSNNIKFKKLSKNENLAQSKRFILSEDLFNTK